MGASLSKSIIGSVGVLALVFTGVAVAGQPAQADSVATVNGAATDPHAMEKVKASRAAGKDGWHSIADRSRERTVKEIQGKKRVKKVRPKSLGSRGLRIGNVKVFGRHVHADVSWDGRTLGKVGNQQFRVRMAGSTKPGSGKRRTVVVEKTLKGTSHEAIDFSLSKAKTKRFGKMAKVYFGVSQRFDSPVDNDKKFEEFHVGSVRLAPAARNDAWRMLSARYGSRFNDQLFSSTKAIDFSGADLRNTYQSVKTKKSSRADIRSVPGTCDSNVQQAYTMVNGNAAGSDYEGWSFSAGTNLTDSIFSGVNLKHSCWAPVGGGTVTANGVTFSPTSSYGSADLHHANLSTASFNNANFSSTNLNVRAIAADMDNINVTKACLDSANFQQASMQNVNFASAGNSDCSSQVMNMVGADATGSNWTGMSLSANSGNLNGVNFTNATMTGVDFGASDISQWLDPYSAYIPTAFTEVDLSAANKVSFAGTDFQGDTFDDADLSGQILGTIYNPAHVVFTDFDYAWFSNANLANTEMTGTFSGAGSVLPGQFQIATFTNGTQLPADLGGIQFDAGSTDWGTDCQTGFDEGYNYAQFTNLTIPNTKFDGSNMVCSNFTATTLDGSTFIDSAIQASNFTNASAQNVNWNQARTGDTAMLHAVTFTNANLSGGNFSDLDLRDLNFSNSNLSNASLNQASLQGANLAGANLTGASLVQANLNGATASGLNNTANCSSTTWYDNATQNGPCQP